MCVLVKKIINRVIFFLFFIFLLFILQALILTKSKINISKVIISKVIGLSGKINKEESPLNFIGEKITYDVRFGMVNLGKAIFQRLAKTELDTKEVNLMTFQTEIMRFSDLEKIYSDANNFLPLKVERDIRTWPGQEKITEKYDQKNFILSITKLKGEKKEEISIQKDGTIHNAILLPYYVRRMPELDVGWALPVRLPTQQFLIRLVSIENVTVPAGTFRSYRFESAPKKFQIWISADAKRIPVKLIGCGALGYALVMRDYSLQE